MSDIGNLEKLMMDTKECLDREPPSFRDEVLARLDLQAARCQAIEAALETKDRQIAGLARRIDVPDGTEHLPMTL